MLGCKRRGERFKRYLGQCVHSEVSQSGIALPKEAMDADMLTGSKRRLDKCMSRKILENLDI